LARVSNPPFDQEAPEGPGTAGVWIFDLDNTLYPASCDLFPQIDRRMKHFIARYLDVPPDEAHRVQKAYYRRFGTTLRGLMLMHGLEPRRFLDYVHAIDLSGLAPDPRLDAALAGLPGRKLVFTNSSERHAGAVLDRLGIARHFEGVFDIQAADFVPKPQPETYARLAERHAIEPRDAVLVDDLIRNLAPAAAIGMTTVWVRHPAHEEAHTHPDDDALPGHVHVVTEDLVAWLQGRAGPASAVS